MNDQIIEYDHNVDYILTGINNANVRVIAKLYLNIKNPSLAVGWVMNVDDCELNLTKEQKDKLQNDACWSAKDMARTLSEDLQLSTTIINSDGKLIKLVA